MHQAIKFAPCEPLKNRESVIALLAATNRSAEWMRVTEQELRRRLEALRSEHRDLDAAIDALVEAGRANGFVDQLQMQRLKKRKLRLKDQIAHIEDTLLPDIIA